MSEDAETARQIAELSLDLRPLLVLDVDEVLIEFVRPFVRFLDGRGVGLKLKLETIRLYGNAIDRATGKLLDALTDSVAVQRGQAERLEDQKIEFVEGHGRSYLNRYEDTTHFYLNR